MTQLSAEFEKDYRDHEATRIDNDRRLAPMEDRLRSAEAVDELERFAKAYLGMYLDLDNHIAPRDRIFVLANEALAEAILEGFVRVLGRRDLPSPEQIADSMLSDDRYAIGYVILAGLDILSINDELDIDAIDEGVLQAAICFHYAYKTEQQDKWVSEALNNKQAILGEPLKRFWLHLVEQDLDYLPGLQDIISSDRHRQIGDDIVMPLLESWSRCRKPLLKQLLYYALWYLDHDRLLQLAAPAIEQEDSANITRNVYWLASAYLIDPRGYEQMLIDYCGRSKEKILPLLDFVEGALNCPQGEAMSIGAQGYATLLRVIAPKLSPQQDRYGNLSDSTQKVMWLFYKLAEQDRDGKAVNWLRDVRVMKLYDAIFEYIEDKRRQDDLGDFPRFLDELVNDERIKRRRLWSD